MFEFFYDFDYALAAWCNAFAVATNGALTPFLRVITTAGNLGLVFIAAAALLLVFRKTRKAGTTALVAMLFGLLLTNIILKNAVARPRPYADVASPFFKFWQNAGSLTESGWSFPSGHTTAATAFALSCFLCFRKRLSWLFLPVPFIMGFTRIYFSVHYASDVVAAMLVGVVCAAAAFFAVRLLRKISVINRWLSPPEKDG